MVGDRGKEAGTAPFLLILQVNVACLQFYLDYYQL